jgi:hypothetical protein
MVYSTSSSSLLRTSLSSASGLVSIPSFALSVLTGMRALIECALTPTRLFLAENDPTIKSFGVPALVVISSTLSCRLVLSLHVNKPNTSALSSLPRLQISARTAHVRLSRPPTPPDHTSTIPVILRDDDVSLRSDRRLERDEEKELEGKGETA